MNNIFINLNDDVMNYILNNNSCIQQTNFLDSIFKNLMQTCGDLHKKLLNVGYIFKSRYSLTKLIKNNLLDKYTFMNLFVDFSDYSINSCNIIDNVGSVGVGGVINLRISIYIGNDNDSFYITLNKFIKLFTHLNYLYVINNGYPTNMIYTNFDVPRELIKLHIDNGYFMMDGINLSNIRILVLNTKNINIKNQKALNNLKILSVRVNSTINLNDLPDSLEYLKIHTIYSETIDHIKLPPNLKQIIILHYIPTTNIILFNNSLISLWIRAYNNITHNVYGFPKNLNHLIIEKYSCYIDKLPTQLKYLNVLEYNHDNIEELISGAINLNTVILSKKSNWNIRTKNDNIKIIKNETPLYEFDQMNIFGELFNL